MAQWRVTNEDAWPTEFSTTPSASQLNSFEIVINPFMAEADII